MEQDARQSDIKTRHIILPAVTVLGLAYGLLSASMDTNPYDDHGVRPDGSPDGRARHWKPSPVWLPAWLLCKMPRNGIGISHTKSGYVFRSETGRRVYRLGSTLLGGVLFFLAGCVVLAVTRRKEKPAAPPPGPG